MNRNFFVVLLAMLGFQVGAAAKCGPGYINAFPTAQSIPAGSIVVTEFAGIFEAYADSVKMDAIRLMLTDDEHQSWPLQYLEIHHGSFGVTQITARLPEDLVLHQKLTLHFYDRKGKNIDSEIPLFTPKTWVVTEKKLTDEPLINLKVNWMFNEYMPLGCGPAKYASFQSDAGDIGRYWISCRLRVENGSWQEFLIPGEKQFKIGHGMCYGLVEFLDGLTYEVEFQLLNYAGIVTSNKEVLRFEAPSAKTHLPKIEIGD